VWVALSAVWALEVRGRRVKTLWEELLRLDPLTGVMVHIVNRNNDVFTRGNGFPVDDYILVEGRGQGLSDDGLVAECLEEAEAQVIEFIGQLLVQLTLDVIRDGTKFGVDFLLQFLVNTRVLVEIADHVGGSKLHCLTARQKQHDNLIDNFFLLPGKHSILHQDIEQVELMFFLFLLRLLPIPNQLPNPFPLPAHITGMPPIKLRQDVEGLEEGEQMHVGLLVAFVAIVQD